VDLLIGGLASALRAERERRTAAEALAMSRGDDCESYKLLAKRLLEELHQAVLERDVLRGQLQIQQRSVRQAAEALAA
jgi:hypothetical protein